MRFNILGLSGLIILSMVACDSKERVKATEQEQQEVVSQQAVSNDHTVGVEEVIQASSYTYIRVKEDDLDYWIATSKQPFEVGMTISYNQGLEMKNFTSKELDRTFESIWFVGKIQSSLSNTSKASGSVSPHGGGQMNQKQGISVEKVAGGITLEELYSKRASYEDKTVSIRGKVTKFNTKIMGRNWVHLQDGTSSDDNFDLTITTMDAVEVGDVVAFSGKVALNKDFGAGYKYTLIMEEAVLINTK